MPQIIVTAHDDDTTVTMRERVNPSDFESEQFAAHSWSDSVGRSTTPPKLSMRTRPSLSRRRSRQRANASGGSPASARATPSRTVSSSRSESRSGRWA